MCLLDTFSVVSISISPALWDFSKRDVPDWGDSLTEQATRKAGSDSSVSSISSTNLWKDLKFSTWWICNGTTHRSGINMPLIKLLV